MTGLFHCHGNWPLICGVVKRRGSGSDRERDSERVTMTRREAAAEGKRDRREREKMDKTGTEIAGEWGRGAGLRSRLKGTGNWSLSYTIKNKDPKMFLACIVLGKTLQVLYSFISLTYFIYRKMVPQRSINERFLRNKLGFPVKLIHRLLFFCCLYF